MSPKSYAQISYSFSQSCLKNPPFYSPLYKRGDRGDFSLYKGEIKRDLKPKIIVFRRHSFLSNNNYFGDIFNYPTGNFDFRV